jgi:hypothetical protein
MATQIPGIFRSIQPSAHLRKLQTENNNYKGKRKREKSDFVFLLQIKINKL